MCTYGDFVFLAKGKHASFAKKKTLHLAPENANVCKTNNSNNNNKNHLSKIIH